MKNITCTIFHLKIIILKAMKKIAVYCIGPYYCNGTHGTVSLTSKLVIGHYVNVSVLIKFSQKTSVFILIIVSSP